jgi:hypothetical protein
MERAQRKREAAVRCEREAEVQRQREAVVQRERALMLARLTARSDALNAPSGTLVRPLTLPVPFVSAEPALPATPPAVARSARVGLLHANNNSNAQPTSTVAQPVP